MNLQLKLLLSILLFLIINHILSSQYDSSKLHLTNQNNSNQAKLELVQNQSEYDSIAHCIILNNKNSPELRKWIDSLYTVRYNPLDYQTAIFLQILRI